VLDLPPVSMVPFFEWVGVEGRYDSLRVVAYFSSLSYALSRRFDNLLLVRHAWMESNSVGVLTWLAFFR